MAQKLFRCKFTLTKLPNKVVGLFAFRKEVIPFIEQNPVVTKSVPVGEMPLLRRNLLNRCKC